MIAQLSADCRFEEAAGLRDRLDALDGVRRTLQRLRRAAARTGVLLAADLDARFVNAFACSGGRVVARRRLPRAGDGLLECRPLAAALVEAASTPAAPLAPDQAEAARVIAAAFARPGRDVVAVPLSPPQLERAAVLVAVRRGSVPLRR